MADFAERSPLRRLIESLRPALPFILVAVYAVLMSSAGHRHDIPSYEETDFYDFYAPDADRIASGQFPENTYNGPAYSTILAGVTGITGDHFTSGKWISIASGCLSGLFAFYIFRRLFDERVATLALLFLLAAGDFALLSITPGMDMAFLAMCLGVVLLFMGDRWGPTWRAGLAGCAAGVTWMTRYNGVFLVVACLTAILVLDRSRAPLSRRLLQAAVHLVSFLAAASPWLWANAAHHGSPLYNTNYLNIATDLYGYPSHQDGTRALSGVVHSFSDVLTGDPKGLAIRYVSNIFWFIGKSFSNDFAILPLGLLGMAGLLTAAFGRRRSRDLGFFLVSMALYFLLMCLTHWENRYFLFILVGYAGLAAYLICEVVDRARSRASASARLAGLAVIAAAGMLLAASTVSSWGRVRSLLDDQASELPGATRYIRDTFGAGARIMSRKPHLPYLSHGVWVFMPEVKSIDELRDALRADPADFFTFDRKVIKLRPELRILGDTDRRPPWLEPVYEEPEHSFILYKVRAVGKGHPRDTGTQAAPPGRRRSSTSGAFRGFTFPDRRGGAKGDIIRRPMRLHGSSRRGRRHQ